MLKLNKGQCMNKWTLEVCEDPDDVDSLVLQFPDDLLAATGWRPGDTIIWQEQDNGDWILKKVENE